MYWNKARARKERQYVPPTAEGEITPRRWLQAAAEVEAAVRAEERAQLPGWWFAAPNSSAARAREGVSEAVAPPRERARRTLHYMRASTDAKQRNLNAWVRKDLRLFEEGDPEAAFFLVDAEQQRGIHCRFGMAGIIAEAHYDSGRNVISMQRGSKRYVLSPPTECANLHILKDGPSARHSGIDWSDPAQVGGLGAALGTEIVISAGDALYVPALWFHCECGGGREGGRGRGRERGKGGRG